MSIVFICILLFGASCAAYTHFALRLHLFGTILINAAIGIAIMRINAHDGNFAVSHGAAFILGVALTIVGDFLFQVLRPNR